MIANLYDQRLKNKAGAARYFRMFLHAARARAMKDNQFTEYARLRLKELN